MANPEYSPHLRQQMYDETRLQLTSDGELESEFVQSVTPLEKKKRLPTLLQSLEDVYQNADDDQKTLLLGLEKECQNFKLLNSDLRKAKMDYVGCRLALDSCYYGPSIIYMICQLLDKNVSGETLIVAAEAPLMVAGAMRLGNFIGKRTTPYPEKRSPNEEYKYRKEGVKKLVENLNHQTQIIRANLKLLNLSETQELKKPYQISKVVDQISGFFIVKHEEERFEAEVRKRAGRERGWN